HATVRSEIKWHKEKCTVQYWIDKGIPIRITAVSLTLEGAGANHPFLTKFKESKTLRLGEIFSTPAYEEIKHNLLNTAQRLGYIHATFLESRVFVDKKNNTARIVLRLDTQERYYFGEIHFSQNPLNSDFLKRFAPFHPGQPYSTTQVLAFQNALSNSG